MQEPDASASAVVVLDETAAVVGAMDKLAAHSHPATRHLAFSVVLFDASGAALLQRRAGTKYHFADRWSNTCCSHPRPGETVLAAARRRVDEELRMQCPPLRAHGAFWYDAEDPDSGLAEHEYDVVLVGQVERLVAPNPDEASEVALRAPDDVFEACRREPDAYTPWLPTALRIALGPAQPIADSVPL